MSISIHRESVVGPDGTIEVSVPELQPGQHVSITIEPDSVSSAAQAPADTIHIIDLIKHLPGNRLFKSAEEVDEYLRQERDAWDS